MKSNSPNSELDLVRTEKEGENLPDSGLATALEAVCKARIPAVIYPSGKTVLEMLCSTTIIRKISCIGNRIFISFEG